MTIFDLFFIVCLLTALAVLFLATVAAAQGRWPEVLTKVRKLSICATIYMGAVLAVSLAFPRKIYRVGDTQCFDDWCIAVQDAARTAESVRVDLRLSSRAKRVPQGEKGTVVYLIDANGHRYNPDPRGPAVGFETLLQPGESVIARRRFHVPHDARGLLLIYTHDGGFPIGFFVIGENNCFHGPPAVRLEEKA
ncbi:MAG: hypothetical protein WA324_29925 [Bryobacteraceae bacterium]